MKTLIFMLSLLVLTISCNTYPEEIEIVKTEDIVVIYRHDRVEVFELSKIQILSETNYWYDNVAITVTDETKQTTTKMSKSEFIKVVTSW